MTGNRTIERSWCFHRRNYADASNLAAAAFASASSVIPGIDRASAPDTTANQCSDGIEPRRRIALAVPYATPRSFAKSVNVGQELMMSVWVMRYRVFIVPCLSSAFGHDLYRSTGYFL